MSTRVSATRAQPLRPRDAVPFRVTWVRSLECERHPHLRQSRRRGRCWSGGGCGWPTAPGPRFTSPASTATLSCPASSLCGRARRWRPGAGAAAPSTRSSAASTCARPARRAGRALDRGGGARAPSPSTRPGTGCAPASMYHGGEVSAGGAARARPRPARRPAAGRADAGRRRPAAGPRGRRRRGLLRRLAPVRLRHHRRALPAGRARPRRARADRRRLRRAQPTRRRG